MTSVINSPLSPLSVIDLICFTAVFEILCCLQQDTQTDILLLDVCCTSVCLSVAKDLALAFLYSKASYRLGEGLDYDKLTSH